MIKIGTDCSGIGSPEQALKNLGINFETEFACEIDKYARQTYLANHECKVMYEDLTKRDNQKTPYVDLYIAGFPCQAFSYAGKREGFNDVRGTIFFYCADYIAKQKPKYFILENVKGLVSHDNGRTFDTILNVLGSTRNNQMQIPFYEDHLNYKLYYQVLNTKDYGLPQNRERIFIIGISEDIQQDFLFPKPEKLELKLKDLLEEEVDSKYNLSERAISTITRQSEKDNGFKFEVDRDIAKALRTDIHKNGTEDNYIKVHSLFPRSGNPKQGGTGHLSKQDGTTYALQCSQSCDNAIEQNNKIRRLTPLECFRLQGFSDSFVKNVSDTQLYRQAGNSISVPVIQKIIKNLILNC